jgi:hypothetical protein
MRHFPTMLLFPQPAIANSKVAKAIIRKLEVD